MKGLEEGNLDGVFPTVIGLSLYTFMKKLTLPRPPAMSHSTKGRYHCSVMLFELISTKFHSLIRGPDREFREFIQTFQAQASEYDVWGNLEIKIHDRFNNDMNHSEIQKELLSNRPNILRRLSNFWAIR